MARRRTQAEKDEVAQLVRDLYARSGETSWADFAQKAGVHWENLSKWQRARVVPDGWSLLQMMRAADADAATVAGLSPGSAAALLELQRVVLAIAAEVGVDLGALEERDGVSTSSAGEAP